jgi:tRNA-splicing ligase RtcB (3'-phosphate/5'-hydroxy nucleic acid ligase)
MEWLVDKRLVSWASIVEDSAREQAERTASMPFIFPHLALMPDVHWGMGATVGSVIPTLGAIMPAAVGVDIGCGMMACKTTVIAEPDWEHEHGGLKSLREAIERVIPLSAGKYNTDLYNDHTQARIKELWETDCVHHAEAIAPNWDKQLGTLGGGNHFIEITVDEEGYIWFFLHSGSRGVGNKLANKHIKTAKKLCERWWIQLPDPDLAYLVEGTDEFWEYIGDLRWAQKFAYLNRAEMMHRVHDQFNRWYGMYVPITETVACHHNYTEQEQHFGKKVWLSRKGAIDASGGTMGLIPGSMGAASYVVMGKGNRLALNSAPHGAGRLYGRKAAKREFTVEQLTASMEGIEWSGSAEFLDEIPGAYKPIDQIMADAADLVEIRHTLRQIVNVKGN